MLSDDYDLVAGLDMRDGKFALSLFYSNEADPEKEVLFLWDAPDGTLHYLFTSCEYFFAFCLMVQECILDKTNQSDDYLSFIADEKWPQIQESLGMMRDDTQALRLLFCSMSFQSGEPSYFRLSADGVEVALSMNSLLVLPQVASFVRNDWRSLIALTR